jgi:hypothetical protein
MSQALPSVPADKSVSVGLLQRVNLFLDEYVLPYPVRFLTNRITILATLALLIPLVLLAYATAFELAANSYLNVMSVVVSSTVLLYATLAEARDRAAAQRREEIAAAHEKSVEERAQADHQKLQEIHAHLEAIHTEVLEHVSKSLDVIQHSMVDRLEKIQAEDHVHIEETHKAILTSIAAHREELGELRQLIVALQLDPPKSDPDLRDMNAS